MSPTHRESRRSPVRATLARSVASLKVVAFRRFFLGQQFVQVGQWTQVVAETWLAVQLSGGSGVAAGAVAAARFLPGLVLGAWIGVAVDRMPKRRILIAAQALNAASAAAVLVMVAIDKASIPTLLGLTLLSGVAFAVDLTTRHAYVVEIAGLDNVSSAAALNGATFNLARILGPLLGGILIANGATAACFAVACFGYLMAGYSCISVGRITTDIRPQAQPRRGQLRAGFTYLRSNGLLRRTVLLTGWYMAFCTNFTVILPVLAQEDLGGDASTYSQLLAAMGLGALLLLPLAATRTTYGPRLVATTCIASGVAFLVASTTVPVGLGLTMAALAAVGAAELMFMSGSATLIQLESTPAMLGRVLSLRGVATQGMVPVGAIAAGLVVDHLGATTGLALSGVCALAGAGAFGLSSRRDARLASEKGAGAYPEASGRRSADQNDAFGDVVSSGPL